MIITDDLQISNPVKCQQTICVKYN